MGHMVWMEVRWGQVGSNGEGLEMAGWLGSRVRWKGPYLGMGRHRLGLLGWERGLHVVRRREGFRRRHQQVVWNDGDMGVLRFPLC